MIDSIQAMKDMAGPDHIINDEAEYELHLSKSMESLFEGKHKAEDYPALNWICALGVYEAENNLPPKSDELYDKILDKMNPRL